MKDFRVFFSEKRDLKFIVSNSFSFFLRINLLTIDSFRMRYNNIQPYILFDFFHYMCKV